MPVSMKQKTGFLFVIVMVSVMLSCKERGVRQQEDPTFTEPEPVTDSVYAQGDTLLLDEEVAESAMPAAVDELFNDFVFLFDQSNRVQRNRILFPLTVTEGADTLARLTRRDWEHQYLFFQKDFCTVLYNYKGQMALSESTQGKWAEVEQIYLHQRQIHQYHFDRDSLGQWILTAERRLGFEQSELGGFLDFYREFATDSIYQRQHLSGSIRYVERDEDMEHEPLQGIISPDQWVEFAPELPRDVLTNIRYGQTYDNPHRMVFEMRGIANGLQVLLVFQQHGGEWRLTALEN